MIFSFLFFNGSCCRPRSRTKRSARTQSKIIRCFWLLQTTHMEEMKAGSTGPPVQLTPLSPILKYCYTLLDYKSVIQISFISNRKYSYKLSAIISSGNISNQSPSLLCSLYIWRALSFFIYVAHG